MNQHGFAKTTNLLDQELHATRVIVSSGDDDGYLPLALGNLVPDTEVSFAVYLKAKHPAADRPEYVLCCPRKETFKAEWVENLRKKGIARVYFPSSEQAEVLAYLQGHLRAVLDYAELGAKEKANLVYDATLLWTRYFYTENQARVGKQILLGLEFVDSLFNCIRREDYQRGWLLELCRADQAIYTHCLNTCLLGLAFTRYLGWGGAEIASFGLGALLHDIGMTKVSPPALLRPGRGSEEVWHQVHQHPVLGHRLLKNLSALSPEALWMVRQHHEHGDGSGYPEGLRLKSIHPWARVLRILDSYEVLTTQRGQRSRPEPREALWIMRQEWEKSRIYDRVYLAKFIQFLSGR